MRSNLHNLEIIKDQTSWSNLTWNLFIRHVMKYKKEAASWHITGEANISYMRWLPSVWDAETACVPKVQPAGLWDRPSGIFTSLLYLVEVCPKGSGVVCHIISHSPTRHKGLCLYFLSLMMRAKVLGPAGVLGNQSRLGGSVLPGPRETGLVQGSLGPCLKSGFSPLPLIRLFMAYLEGQGVICLAHVFSFIP